MEGPRCRVRVQISWPQHCCCPCPSLCRGGGLGGEGHGRDLLQPKADAAFACREPPSPRVASQPPSSTSQTCSRFVSSRKTGGSITPRDRSPECGTRCRDCQGKSLRAQPGSSLHLQELWSCLVFPKLWPLAVPFPVFYKHGGLFCLCLFLLGDDSFLLKAPRDGEQLCGFAAAWSRC